jgi:MFS family permease
VSVSSPTDSLPAAAEPDPIDPAVWRMAFTIIVGALAVVFDTTIVSVAINDLGRDLHAPLSTIQWVSTGYLLAMFVTIPIAGWAQSAIGGKRLWIAALGMFLAGSILCAAAWNAPSLIVFRVVQGIGGGVMMPLMMTLIMQAARGHHIGKVVATITLPVTLGPILGPVLGGVILHLGDWRRLFLVNVPFCAVGGWLALRALASSSVLGFLTGATLYGAMILLPLYWQQVRGEDALGAGLLLIPQGVGTLLSRSLAGTYTDRFGPRWVALTGFAVVAAATVPFGVVTADTSKVLLLAALLVRGAALGVATIPLTGAAFVGLGHTEIPHASIITRVAQQIGGSIGTAVLAVILQHAAAGARTHDALANAFGDAFWWSVAFTALAVPVCLLLPGRPTPPPTTTADAEAEAAIPV